MIYITGDCHSIFNRFATKRFRIQKQMTKKDYVIVTGDFGLWNNAPSQRWWFDWLEDKPFTTLFIDGNHENFDMLKKIKVESWNGGKIQKIRPSIIRLMRGQVFDIDGCKIFAFGGARSHDIQAGILDQKDKDFHRKRKQLDKEMACYRVNHVSWWQEEMPSLEEMNEGLENLAKHDFAVDYIITHECSTYTKILLSNGFYPADELFNYLQTIKDQTQFKKWYFGHYHEDRAINSEEVVLYDQITQIW